MMIYRSLSELPIQSAGTSVCIGVFDGLHRGHHAVIEAAVSSAKKTGTIPTLFTFKMDLDNKPRSKQTNDRISPAKLFVKQVEEMGIQQIIAPHFHEIKNFSPPYFVQEFLANRLQAKSVFCGTNFHFGKDAEATAEDLVEYGQKIGMEVDYLPLVTYEGEPISSSRIRRCIMQGDMKSANDMLGYFYTTYFPVEQGKKLGRQLGFPTINQHYPAGYVLPRFGVYASLTGVDGKLYSSVTNVGTNPTVDGDKIIAETNIFDFSGDLYGRIVPVFFLKFLRAEQRFDGLEELKSAMDHDSIESKTLAAGCLSSGCAAKMTGGLQYV